MPRVSIVIPHHNHGEFVEETLRSARGQTWRNLEIVLVDDGSTDPRSQEVLRKLESEGLEVHRLEKGGPSRARNHGISRCTGTYILPLDADDLLDPRAVQSMVAALEGSDASVAIPRTMLFGCDRGELFLGPWDRRNVLVSNVAPCTSLFRKSDWERLGGYNENMTEGYEDWDFWMSFLERDLRAVRVPQAIFHYRIKKVSRNPGQERILARARMHARMIANHPGLADGLEALLESYYRTRAVTWNRLLWRRIVQIPRSLGSLWWGWFPGPSPAPAKPQENR